MPHPSESDLALFASGDCRWPRRWMVERHLYTCGDCRDTLASYGDLRNALSHQAAPELNWNALAGEMRANIRVGLAAGECVREPVASTWRKPQLGFALAGVLLIAGAGVFLRGLLPHDVATPAIRASVLESTGAGVEVRSGSGGSMTLLNHGDIAGDRTVTSEGAIRANYVDGSTGTVTITSVYVD